MPTCANCKGPLLFEAFFCSTCGISPTGQANSGQPGSRAGTSRPPSAARVLGVLAAVAGVVVLAVLASERGGSNSAGRQEGNNVQTENPSPNPSMVTDPIVAPYRPSTPTPHAYVPLTFYGYECTEDCAGHEAGYQWAEDNGIDNPDDCGANSESFIEGCRAYAEEQQQGVDEDSSESDE